MLLEIQATLGRPPSTAVSMMKSVYLAYVVVLLAYFPVAISGSCTMQHSKHLLSLLVKR